MEISFDFKGDPNGGLINSCESVRTHDHSTIIVTVVINFPSSFLSSLSFIPCAAAAAAALSSFGKGKWSLLRRRK